MAPTRAISPDIAARANRSAAARSAWPSAPVSSRARSPSPSASRAHASADSVLFPERLQHPAAVSCTVGASNRTSWQRERIVGSTSASRSDSRIR